MSASDQSRRFGREPVTSGLHPTPEMSSRRNNWRDVPKSDLCSAAKASLFIGLYPTMLYHSAYLTGWGIPASELSPNAEKHTKRISSR
jgi:hypothetical protein